MSGLQQHPSGIVESMEAAPQNTALQPRTIQKALTNFVQQTEIQIKHVSS